MDETVREMSSLRIETPPVTLRAMAQVRGVDVESLAAAVTANTERAFGAW